jgi:hypothetical protein
LEETIRIIRELNWAFYCTQKISTRERDYNYGDEENEEYFENMYNWGFHYEFKLFK